MKIVAVEPTSSCRACLLDERRKFRLLSTSSIMDSPNQREYQRVLIEQINCKSIGKGALQFELTARRVIHAKKTNTDELHTLEM